MPALETGHVYLQKDTLKMYIQIRILIVFFHTNTVCLWFQICQKLVTPKSTVTSIPHKWRRRKLKAQWGHSFRLAEPLHEQLIKYIWNIYDMLMTRVCLLKRLKVKILIVLVIWTIVTVESPVEMPPIDHVCWLLGQEDFPLADWLACMSITQESGDWRPPGSSAPCQASWLVKLTMKHNVATRLLSSVSWPTQTWVNSECVKPIWRD